MQVATTISQNSIDSFKQNLYLPFKRKTFLKNLYSMKHTLTRKQVYYVSSHSEEPRAWKHLGVQERISVLFLKLFLATFSENR